MTSKFLSKFSIIYVNGHSSYIIIYLYETFIYPTKLKILKEYTKLKPIRRISKYKTLYPTKLKILKEYENITPKKKIIKILGNASIDFSLPFGFLNCFNINVGNGKEY